MKNPTSFRLSPTAIELLKRLSDELSISQSAVIEVALRQLAKAHDIKTEQR